MLEGSCLAGGILGNLLAAFNLVRANSRFSTIRIHHSGKLKQWARALSRISSAGKVPNKGRYVPLLPTRCLLSKLALTLGF